MKKATVALLMVLLIASFGLFADDLVDETFHPGPPTILTDCLAVKTLIPSISWMWIAPCFAQGQGPTLENNWDCGPHCTQYYVTGPGEQNVGKCLYVLSNNRGGYRVNMKAKALKCDWLGFNTYINYRATCGDASVETNNDPFVDAADPVEIFANLHMLQMTCNPIGINVNPWEYMLAASGFYTGVIFFTFIAC
ncbi:hypothetical protein SpiGrapes_1368 [Sphaerochaeta pleomorpha str. Grapes]|uniref:Uncharacterized protein n=1 Tax=Sphaerochaeta pleomorpha (strain ATCC BAA-1885 / DSM 22778 / Grapes) TaxID=158190 RepID=G8QUE7_SPHPG|nr:hypothetical protein [Sphaerochaeta pleomorpha]AEV29180.1 hypothetical protein SpiGrapes_1368 [Sphaerochaeta pleomorpha str. Grapes]